MGGLSYREASRVIIKAKEERTTIHLSVLRAADVIMWEDKTMTACGRYRMRCVAHVDLVDGVSCKECKETAVYAELEEQRKANYVSDLLFRR